MLLFGWLADCLTIRPADSSSDGMQAARGGSAGRGRKRGGGGGGGGRGKAVPRPRAGLSLQEYPTPEISDHSLSEDSSDSESGAMKKAYKYNPNHPCLAYGRKPYLGYLRSVCELGFTGRAWFYKSP